MLKSIFNGKLFLHKLSYSQTLILFCSFFVYLASVISELKVSIEPVVIGETSFINITATSGDDLTVFVVLGDGTGNELTAASASEVSITSMSKLKSNLM